MILQQTVGAIAQQPTYGLMPAWAWVTTAVELGPSVHLTSLTGRYDPAIGLSGRFAKAISLDGRNAHTINLDGRADQ